MGKRLFHPMYKLSCLRKALRGNLMSHVHRGPVDFLYIYTDTLSETLTPNKLLYGRDINTENVEIMDDELIGVERSSEKLQTMRKHVERFWKMWRDEYLLELRERDVKTKARGSAQPSKGDVVVIKDEKLKRSEWRIGQIDKVIKSKDGKIRSAEVNVMSNGKRSKLTRPVNKLYPVEFTEETTDVEEPVITFVNDDAIPAHLFSGVC